MVIVNKVSTVSRVSVTVNVTDFAIEPVVAVVEVVTKYMEASRSWKYSLPLARKAQ